VQTQYAHFLISINFDVDIVVHDQDLHVWYKINWYYTVYVDNFARGKFCDVCVTEYSRGSKFCENGLVFSWIHISTKFRVWFIFTCWSRYLRFHYCHWVTTSADGQLLPVCIIHPTVQALLDIFMLKIYSSQIM
jgi:hypothetical protein